MWISARAGARAGACGYCACRVLVKENLMLIILTNCVNRQTNTEGGTFLLNYFFGYDPNSINVSGDQCVRGPAEELASDASKISWCWDEHLWMKVLLETY